MRDVVASRSSDGIPRALGVGRADGLRANAVAGVGLSGVVAEAVGRVPTAVRRVGETRGRGEIVCAGNNGVGRVADESRRCTLRGANRRAIVRRAGKSGVVLVAPLGATETREAEVGLLPGAGARGSDAGARRCDGGAVDTNDAGLLSADLARASGPRAVQTCLAIRLRVESRTGSCRRHGRGQRDGKRGHGC